MSLEENKALVRRFVEAYNNRNLDVFDELLAPNYFDHTSQVDREGLKQLMNMAFTAFPDFQEAIHDIIAEGDEVWARITFTGTHRGEWMGIAPTGKTVTTEMVDIFRIENGKLAEYRDVNNNVDFLKKLGLIEYTEQGKQLLPQE
ncbi:MAG: ester cyclase [Candidatus Bathyarchaeota archaeon]|jgi:steroid delta-isomerase-like uncharacterized protein|nr:ester cyclase [Candidatus Bathyarchaeota archaeon]